jgi:hypothetical protein
MNADFDPIQVYRRLLAGWMWIVGAGVIGGLLGLAVASMRPPLVEAKAVLEIGIDRSRADVPDDITVRQAYDRVRGLLLADDTLQEALALAAERGGGTSGESVRALLERIRLSERPDGWVLAVAGADARETELLAQAWVDVALRQLETAATHATRAAEAQGALFEASCRLVTPEPGSEAALWLCRSAPPTGSDSIPESILSEVEASRGILPAVSYSVLRGAEGTAQPVVWRRGSLILGGAIVGLLVGCLIVAARKRPASA